VGRLTGQKTGWAESATGPILDLKTKINNTKPDGLPGVLGLNQFGLHRRMKKTVFEFSPWFLFIFI
jgi:hypothetical protein